MRLSCKTEEYIQPVLTYLEQQGIPFRVERDFKRVTVQAVVNGHRVLWYPSYWMSDHRAAQQFQLKVQRTIKRFCQLDKGPTP